MLSASYFSSLCSLYGCSLSVLIAFLAHKMKIVCSRLSAGRDLYYLSESISHYPQDLWKVHGSHRHRPRTKIVEYKIIFNVNTRFLAPTGAQGVTLSVRSFVRSVQVCLEQSIFIILAQIFKQSVRNQSGHNGVRIVCCSPSDNTSLAATAKDELRE